MSALILDKQEILLSAISTSVILHPICFIAFAHSIAVFSETSLSEPSPPFNNKMCKFS